MAGRRMKRRTYCVYNATRECFLSLNIEVANTIFTRLRGLLGRFRLRPDEGIWYVPSQGVHTIGLFFRLDLLYLDKDLQVIHLIEYFQPFRIAPFKKQAATVLELPTHTIYSSHTEAGDQLVICTVEEMEQRLNKVMARISQTLQETER